MILCIVIGLNSCELQLDSIRMKDARSIDIRGIEVNGPKPKQQKAILVELLIKRWKKFLKTKSEKAKNVRWNIWGSTFKLQTNSEYKREKAMTSSSQANLNNGVEIASIAEIFQPSDSRCYLLRSTSRFALCTKLHQIACKWRWWWWRHQLLFACFWRNTFAVVACNDITCKNDDVINSQLWLPVIIWLVQFDAFLNSFTSSNQRCWWRHINFLAFFRCY